MMMKKSNSKTKCTFWDEICCGCCCRSRKQQSYFVLGAVLSIVCLFLYEHSPPIDIRTLNINNKYSSHSQQQQQQQGRAFVCITGQLPRLDLENKLQNLILPWIQENQIHIDIALVLSDSDNHSINRAGDRKQKFFSMDDVLSYLHKQTSSVRDYVSILNTELDIQSIKPILNIQYMDHRGNGTKQTLDELKHRVRNHIRQFESMAKCQRLLSRQLALKNPSTIHSYYYDIVHRIRDDVGYYERVSYTKIHSALYSSSSSSSSSKSSLMTLLVPECESHGGINDRGAFTTQYASYDYFVHPILSMYLGGELPSDVVNTERFLKYYYDQTFDMIVESSDFHLFRLWDGNDDGNKDGEVVYSGGDLDCIQKKKLNLKQQPKNLRHDDDDDDEKKKKTMMKKKKTEKHHP